LRCDLLWHAPGQEAAEFERVTRALEIPPGYGLPGRVFSRREPEWLGHVEADALLTRPDGTAAFGPRTTLAFPILAAERPLGVLEAFIASATEPDRDLLATLTGIGRQVAQVVARAAGARELRDREARLRGIL